MSYKKGESGNPNGRPKGAHNKMSAEQRDYLRDILRKNKEKFELRLEKLGDKEYVWAYIMLMQYVFPKPSTAELKEVPKLEEFIAMTPEERQVAMEEIRESLREKEGIEMRKEVIEERKRKRYGI
jgi:hypothetical protein